jgi:hypothetical protein
MEKDLSHLHTGHRLPPGQLKLANGAMREVKPRLFKQQEE